MISKPREAVGVDALPYDAKTFLTAVAVSACVYRLIGVAAALVGAFSSASIEVGLITMKLVASLLILFFAILAARIGGIFASDSPRNADSPVRMIRSAIYDFGITMSTVSIFAAIWVRLLSKLEPDVSFAKQEAVTALLATDSVFLRAILICQAVVFAPIAEEIFFRGFVYKVLKNYGNGLAAIGATSFFFALLHNNAVAFVPMFVLSVCLVKIYERDADIRGAIVVHSLFNLLNIARM
ncbi:MAG: CPBP family intramembrane metalloprotease [Puniceicoccales bacterium]|nr:CPBP family intramembrane metalloprotease [Puniceicoccales bacterium]